MEKMTAQISDSFNYLGESYAIVAISENRKLFDPEEYGLHPDFIETCCWAGYWCEFEISDALYLQRLFVHCDDGNYPDICGRSISEQLGSRQEQSVAASFRFGDSGYQLYENMNMKIPYTGKILVGSGFISRYYIHMGYQRAYAYEKLLEFEFEDGNLKKISDLSDKAEEIRKKIGNTNVRDFEHNSDIPLFIHQSFSLSYDDKVRWNNENKE